MARRKVSIEPGYKFAPQSGDALEVARLEHQQHLDTTTPSATSYGAFPSAKKKKPMNTIFSCLSSMSQPILDLLAVRTGQKQKNVGYYEYDKPGIELASS